MSAIIYLLQVSACLALFYGFYYLLLNRLTFFTINRYYLLFSLVFSFIVPLLTITVNQQYSAVPVMQQVANIGSHQNMSNYVAAPLAYTLKPRTFVTWMQLLNWSYIAAVAGLTIHLLITLFNFFIKLKRRKLSSLGNVHILRGDKKLPNGSFLNYIFLNDDALSSEEMEQVVAHEMLHVKLYHSADRILMKLVQIILWFNPLVYFYARSMEENHEFEVDREVARSTDKTKYADLLLHLSVANQGMLYHSFSKVPLKKRIIMLFNKPSAKVKRAVYILILPVIAISCLAFGKIKKDDIKIDLVKSGREILTSIKSGQDNLVAQLNKPVQLPNLTNSDIKPTILTAHSINTIDINTASQPVIIPAVINDTTRYSLFGDVPKYTKVIINGKEYPKEILYEINNTNMTGINAHNGGTINLKTKDGELIYLTAHEKENLRKERSIPRSQFYTRLELTRDNGERYDYVAVHLQSRGGGGGKISPTDKVVFKINDRLYEENEINTVPPESIASLKSIGSATYRSDRLYLNKYKMAFTLITPEYEQQHAADNFVTQTPFDDGQTVKMFRNYIVAGYPTDTIAYNAKPYKTNLGPDAKLIELINRLPNFTTKENAVYIGDKSISVLFVDRREYAGSVMMGLKNIFVGNTAEVRVTSPDPQNKNPAILYIITKPN
ncbi:MAG: M56 family metallopeptidase [Sphingobacteriaceae bacterium]|nr:MAG: M56 family metallopeptidase [Sphingobacteriaceae bacterium]